MGYSWSEVFLLGASGRTGRFFKAIEKSVMKEGEPVLYYLKDGPKRGFVREELMIIPKEAELSPERLSFL